MHAFHSNNSCQWIFVKVKYLSDYLSEKFELNVGDSSERLKIHHCIDMTVLLIIEKLDCGGTTL